MEAWEWLHSIDRDLANSKFSGDRHYEDALQLTCHFYTGQSKLGSFRTVARLKTLYNVSYHLINGREMVS